MKPRKISRKDLHSGCEQVGEQDGLDPRLDRPDAGTGPKKVKNRKALQLCSQVAETLNFVLSGEVDDDVLRDLFIESVTPAPDTSRLLVTLAPGPASGPVDPAQVLEHLQALHGQLRQEVASAINRRRTPELAFRVRVG